MYEQEAVVHHESGIHARIAAMIVQRAQELSEKYATPLFLRSRRSERLEMRSLMKLVALKIRKGDSLFVSAEGDAGRQAVYEMVRFLEGDFEMREPGKIHEMDKLLHENALMQERLQMILEAVQDGICVVDRTGEITYVNPSYLRIVHKTPEMVMGQNVFKTAPDGNRCAVLRTGVARIGSISRKKDGTTVVANVNPIFVNGEIAGVVSVIKDITELQNLMARLSQVSAKAEYLEQELLRTKKTANAFANYIGKSGKVIDVLALASKAANSGATVLIRGESGTGKEVIAEGIHYASERRRGPFIRVNCGAIPGTLLESELFGHEKGAFTGAVKRKLGKFELADHGTIFLDEIGEMDKKMQVKLLRVLQQKEFDRVGGEETVHVDVRIIAATNRHLEDMVKEGTFRDDLYYRLNVIPIILPPLRERIDDIPLLVEHFIEKISAVTGKTVRSITPEAMDILMRYKWLGNVRELENVIERVITLMDSDTITVASLPSYIKGEAADREVQRLDEESAVLPWEEYEKRIIAKALKQCGSFNAAAKELRITHKTVAAKARKYGLS
ncbi:putative sigma54 specific transcriptional regulator [Selenomonas ruminantium subsp. lactilytica TAM6421]|uniref:HTH-type transcriptional regulatory protein TyrR n=1 Tax=Selenomonas ruminantium subsp. lactilytica (strain NBRC 103574 / TAM6421) TaxID=927704 RepID=I0GUE2_SELRL|nr:sigma 54-interacting transcriptional regulator [Selenomonas ruminantium]BAL84379.1 putative sigma54 specific transcriptional regulator [Selenomonas ruminantium subsp. lactilytica TAM6421]